MPDAVELVKTIKKTAVDALKSTKPVEICFGRVISISPLKILVDQKLSLGEAQLILTRNVTDYKVEMTVSHSTESALNLNISHTHGYRGETEIYFGNTETDGETEPHVHAYSHLHAYSGNTDAGGSMNLKHAHEYSGRKTFTVHNGLVVGDEIILLRQQGGQKYVVVDRII